MARIDDPNGRADHKVDVNLKIPPRCPSLPHAFPDVTASTITPPDSPEHPHPQSRRAGLPSSCLSQASDALPDPL
jgi:hypothetical protein